MLLFASLGIYFFNHTLKSEAIKSHKLMYSLFLPSISSDLWEFDIDGIRTTASNIMKNNYATRIFVYDIDAKKTLGYINHLEKNFIEETSNDSLSDYKFSPSNTKKLTSIENNSEHIELIEMNTSKSYSTVIGVLYHKKIGSQASKPIGYAVFTYSNKEIEKLITQSVIAIVVISTFITVILVALISILLFNIMADQINQNQEQLRLIAEQETARLVQMNLLPSSSLKRMARFEIIGHFQSATECAGDWWNAYLLPKNKLLILLGDVTGHGTGSALLTAVVKGYCDSLCHSPEISTQNILAQLDKIVLNIGKGERVMTMFAAILDSELNTIEFSNAAHNFPFMIRNSSENKKITKLIANGKPLGFNGAQNFDGSQNAGEKFGNEKIKFASKVMNFQMGDLIFIFSDGLIEAVNSKGVEFSDKNLKKILELVCDKNVTEIKEEVLKKFREFTNTSTLADDMTFVVCKFV